MHDNPNPVIEATVTDRPKNKWKKRIGTLLFILLNAGVILYTALREFSTDELHDPVRVPWYLLFPALFCCVLAIAAETLKYCLVMKKTCGYVRPKLALQTVLLGRYYDNITPSGVGGQPFQILHLSKNGVPGGQSAAITVAGFMSMQYAFILVALVSFVFGGFFTRDFGLFRIGRYIGLVLYAIFPTAILLFAFFPKSFTKLLTGCVGLLHKLHIVKDRDKAVQSVENSLAEYSVSLKALVKEKKLCVQIMVLSVIYQCAISSIPFFVVRAFGGEIGFFNCFIMTTSIYATITFIPTPGNAGAAEASFYEVFSSLAGGKMFWAMLTWRFFVYYIFIIAGPCVYLEHYISNKRKKRSQSL